MSVLVQFLSNIDSLDSWERGHSIEELTAGLSEAAAKREKPTTSAAAGEPVDAGKLREALSYLDADVPYDNWRDIVAGIGAANCSEAREIAHEWSEGKLDRLGRYKDAQPSRYHGPEPVDAVLNTMPPTPGGIGVGSVEHAARAAGWSGTLAPRRPAAETFAGYLAQELAPAPKEIHAAIQDGKLLPSYMGGEIAAIIPPRWLISPIVPTPAVGMVFGKFGSFKTTAALDLEDAVLIGASAFGQFKSERGDVVSVAGEGLSGLKNRIEARARVHGLTLDQYLLLLVAKVPRVNQPDEWAALVATIEARGLKPKLIIIDHLSIMLSGQDQNDATVATQAMQMAHELAAHFNCTVIILAHAGKEGEREVRGSSAFLDNVDFAYELTRVEGADMVRVRCAKMRDGEAPEPFFLKAESRHGAAILSYADKDAAKRAAGHNVGLRVSEVSATLQAFGACPGGPNEWSGKAGGIPTKALAAEIARLRHEAAGDALEASVQEIASLVTILNRDGRQGGKFDALVVRQGPQGRQWAIAPGPIAREHDHG